MRVVSDPRTLARGSVVGGRYRVEALIAHGKRASVFRALDPQGVEVALKIFTPSGEDDAIALKRFLQEAEVTAWLKSEHTVRVLDFAEAPDGFVYLVMELIRGPTLRQELAERTFSEAEAIDVAAQIAASLSEAHARGLVHRDLKPENVMIDRTAGQKVRVLDFGIAKRADVSITIAQGPPCTPAYASPEVARGGNVTPQSDLYSLGVIIYELITGSPPFRGESDLATLYMHTMTPAPKLSGVSEELASIVERVLSKTERARFADALQMRAALLAARVDPEDLETLRDEDGRATVMEDQRPARPLRVPVERTLSKRRIEAINEAVDPTRRNLTAQSSLPKIALMLGALAVLVAGFAIFMLLSG
jgi:serine/threonine-protein kinase